MADLEACYGAENMRPSAVRMITVAPELDATASVVASLASRGIVVAVGHSNATYEEMVAAVQQGATMITHLFNAISTPNQRAPGILGVLGAQHLSRPYYGIIADNVHVHPAMVGVAYRAHPDGLILVSDALCVLGMPDGEYQYNDKVVVKSGEKATLKDSGTIAGG
jgi:N-acetylglucosamine-6-phosphate deacetylase